jgi:hypothetical protein
MGLFARRKALKWTHELGEWARAAKDNRAASEDDRQYARGVSFYVRSLATHDVDPEERTTEWTVQVLDGMQDANFLVNDVLRKGARASTDFRAALRSAHVRRLAEEQRLRDQATSFDESSELIESVRARFSPSNGRFASRDERRGDPGPSQDPLF